MDEKKTSDAIQAGSYDASNKPFDFVLEGGTTALVCESDPVALEKLGAVLEVMGYRVTKVADAPDALKSMRFHLYDLITVGEGPNEDDVLAHIRHLPMGVRRNIFVVLLSTTVRTMDNMAAFGRSVNLVINRENIGEAGAIIQRGIADNDAFYETFREALKRAGRL
ncbi:MAG: hypothetical protein JRE40_06895 [Deltaproteobacteria bacterium]|nr:hypothetical protein [Deltaproteobacteria bacterium]MBW2673805.1 hypothetical protein [Deltaproteobacteria bacterium]